MNSTITRWGVGPRFTVISICGGAVVLLLQALVLPPMNFSIINRTVTLTLGILLIAAGIPLFVIPALTIDRYFESGRLCTTGVYAVMRHPIYGAWISFIVPGIVLLMGSVPGIIVPVFMYAVFRKLIPREETYLQAKFGNAYDAYRERVGSVFPRMW